MRKFSFLHIAEKLSVFRMPKHIATKLGFYAGWELVFSDSDSERLQNENKCKIKYSSAKFTSFIYSLCLGN
jgi:hypothetical protein